MAKSDDTVTPVETPPEGRNVSTPAVATAPQENVSPDEYTTQGQTTVATPHGYEFQSNNKDIPVITAAGLNVTADQAKSLVTESDDLVFVVQKED